MYTIIIFVMLQLGSYISQSSSNVDEVLILDVDDQNRNLVTVHCELTNRMKDHQKQGVKFMWDACYESVKRLNEHSGYGCILAHCMGLGKTFQVKLQLTYI